MNLKNVTEDRFDPHKTVKKSVIHTYIVISENTLHEMLSNPHELILEDLLS
jgi:hypothetical protein